MPLKRITLQAYIYDNIEYESTFYVVNKRFFDSWSLNSGFTSEKSSFAIKKEEKLKEMDNQMLVEQYHSQRLRDVEYGQDFVVLPRNVFFPLSKWYKCNIVIERKVIAYKQDKNRALNLFKNKKSVSQSGLENSKLADIEKSFKVVGDTTYELELYPKFIYFEKISDKGERPH